MPTPAIEFANVTKVYRRRLAGEEIAALSDVSFEVMPGEVCAFLGPNGAGKTTSISILMGFLYADAGEIRVLGCQPGDVRAKSQIGFLPENFAFYKFLNAEQLLRLHCTLAGRQSQEQDLIAGLLRKVHLDEYPKLKIGKYSRGMMQRLGIAQALAGDPRLLVLDEPTSGLDPAGRKEVRDLILSLKAAGNTVFLSSHILSEAEQICDRAIIVDHGKVIRAGTLDELLASGDRVELVTSQLTPELEAAVNEWGGAVERIAQGVKITIGLERKRELAEKLWAAGCDVISLTPLRSSLEEFFLKLVSRDGGAS